MGVGYFGSEKQRGFKICMIQGDLLVCGGLYFPGGFGFRRRKSPLLSLESTNFQKNAPAADHFLSHFNNQLSFSENNMVNTVK